MKHGSKFNSQGLCTKLLITDELYSHFKENIDD